MKDLITKIAEEESIDLGLSANDFILFAEKGAEIKFNKSLEEAIEQKSNELEDIVEISNFILELVTIGADNLRSGFEKTQTEKFNEAEVIAKELLGKVYFETRIQPLSILIVELAKEIGLDTKLAKICALLKDAYLKDKSILNFIQTKFGLEVVNTIKLFHETENMYDLISTNEIAKLIFAAEVISKYENEKNSDSLNEEIQIADSYDLFPYLIKEHVFKV